MEKVMFFDSNFNLVKQPDFDKCDSDDFWQLILKADYIFVDGKDALEEFKSVVNKFAEDEPTNTIHDINDVGAYHYNYDGDYGWKSIQDEIHNLEMVKQSVIQAYILNSRLPFEGEEEL